MQRTWIMYHVKQQFSARNSHKCALYSLILGVAHTPEGDFLAHISQRESIEWTYHLFSFIIPSPYITANVDCWLHIGVLLLLPPGKIDQSLAPRLRELKRGGIRNSNKKYCNPFYSTVMHTRSHWRARAEYIQRGRALTTLLFREIIVHLLALWGIQHTGACIKRHHLFT